VLSPKNSGRTTICVLSLRARVYHGLNRFYVGFEVPTVLTMKTTILWGMMLYRLIEVYKHFRKLTAFIFMIKE
jgi:hypothetical protein